MNRSYLKKRILQMALALIGIIVISLIGVYCFMPQKMDCAKVIDGVWETSEEEDNVTVSFDGVFEKANRFSKEMEYSGSICVEFENQKEKNFKIEEANFSFQKADNANQYVSLGEYYPHYFENCVSMIHINIDQSKWNVRISLNDNWEEEKILDQEEYEKKFAADEMPDDFDGGWIRCTMEF